MTRLEKKSANKKKALIKLVETGEYSIAFAMMEAERLNDEGKLLDNDYDEVVAYLEELMQPKEEPQEILFNEEENNEIVEEGE